MRRLEAAGLAAIMILWTIASGRADVDAEAGSELVGRSYLGIAERNPFGLKPPAPAVPVTPPQPTNQVSKSDVKLTGFVTLGGKRAFFMWTDDKTKRTESFSLAVDQERDGLRVLEIDEVARSVRVTESGAEKLMTFASHGLTNAVAVAATGTGQPGAMVPGRGGAPGSTGSPTTPVPTPMATPGGTSPTAPGTTPGLRTIPSRNLRVQQDTGANTIMAGASASVNVPGRSSGGFNQGVPIPAPQPSRNIEEQVLMMELQRTVNPDLPPTPPVR